MNISTKYDINQRVLAFTPETWNKEFGHIFEIKIVRLDWILYNIKFEKENLKNCWCVEETVFASK